MGRETITTNYARFIIRKMLFTSVTITLIELHVTIKCTYSTRAHIILPHTTVVVYYQTIRLGTIDYTLTVQHFDPILNILFNLRGSIFNKNISQKFTS